MSAVKRKNVANHRWLCGDSETSISIAASGTLECAAVDLSQIDLSNASIILARASGSGTLKISGEVSPDGVSAKHALGDLITGVTTAPGIFELSAAAMDYGRYLIITVTETGGASAANAQCVFSAQGV